jgi:hypothetical protein
VRGKRKEGPPTELFTRLDEATHEALLAAEHSRGFASRGELLWEILTAWAHTPKHRRRVEVPAPKNRGPRTLGVAFVRPGAEVAKEMVAAYSMPNTLFYAILVAWADRRRKR